MFFLFVLLLAALVGAAHALVALAGVAIAARADVDRVQAADILVAVMAAGRHGAMNGLIHDDVPPQFCFGPASIVGH